MAYLSIDDDEPETKPLPTADEVRAEIVDWQRRIADLFRDVESWVPPSEGYEVDTSVVTSVEEPIMTHYGIPAYRVPLLQVRQNGEQALVLMPRERWVLFWRGSVTVLVGAKPTNDKVWHLLARDGEAGRIEWRLTGRRRPRGGDPWTQEAFRTLLAGGA